MSALQQLLVKAGYSAETYEHFPKTENAEAKVSRLEQLIKDAGFERAKSKEGSEYQYEYEVGEDLVIFNYRMGDTGLSAWWS